MYLWKYWRESRISFAFGVVLIGLLLWAVLRMHPGFGPQSDAAEFYALTGGVLTLPFAFMGLRFGSFGVGRDLGEGSGAFLFSRPRTRAFFVWSDWGFGMAQMLALIVATNAVFLLGTHRTVAAGGAHVVDHSPISTLSIFCVHCAAGLLLVGLMFGLTYFSSVLSRGRGVLLAIGIVVVYLIGKSVVKHYWPAVDLPNLTLTEFSIHNVTTQQAFPNGGYARETRTALLGFADHLGLSIALRAALALVFPFAAQMLVQASDVD